MNALTKAINYLIQEPEVKSIHRKVFEYDFFKKTGLSYIVGEDDQKEFVLTIENMESVWVNSVAWLDTLCSVLEDRPFHITFRSSREKTTTYSFTQCDVHEAVQSVRDTHISWTVGMSVVAIDEGMVDNNGLLVNNDTVYSIIAIDEHGEEAYTHCGLALSRGMIVDGSLVMRHTN